MGDFSRPMPVPTPTTQPFWDALAEHKIRIPVSYTHLTLPTIYSV